MCGRYARTLDPGALASYLGAEEAASEKLEPSYNVAPTDPVYAVAEQRGRRLLGTMRWGLIPHWSPDRKGPLNINARAETAAVKPAFRDSLRRKRCLIPADGFYEWEPKREGRRPHYVTLASGEPMMFAGIWAARRDPEVDGWIRSCAIITTVANRRLSGIHTRMPVILEPESWDMWLDREMREPAALEPLLAPLRSEAVAEHPVSDLVNNVRNNLPENIAPRPAGLV